MKIVIIDTDKQNKFCIVQRKEDDGSEISIPQTVQIDGDWEDRYSELQIKFKICEK